MAVRLLIFFSFFTLSLYAQPGFSFNEIEQKTWQYYQQNNWDSLIDLGEKAISNNIDYFYLRARIGYAYYIKANYTKAIIHLTKAREFNSKDVFVFETLYYAYLFSNQAIEANYLIKNNSELATQTTLKHLFLQMAYIESNISQPQTNIIFFEKKNPNNIKWLQGNQIHSVTYNAAGFQFTSSKHSLTLFSYANLIMDMSRQIWIENNSIEDRYRLFQHQMYFNTLLRLKYKWYLLPAANWIIVNYETLNSNYNKNDNKVELWRDQIFLNNFAISLSLKHRFQNAEWDIHASVSNLNRLKQQNTGTTLYLYPKGNLNLYVIGSVALSSQNNKTYTIFDEKIGIKVFPKMWFEQNASIGKISNYAENYAYVIHNTTDICNYRAAAHLIFPFNKFKFSIRYMLLFKSSSYDYYDNHFKTDHYDYLEHSLYMNLSWWI